MGDVIDDFTKVMLLNLKAKAKRSVDNGYSKHPMDENR